MSVGVCFLSYVTSFLSVVVFVLLCHLSLIQFQPFSLTSLTSNLDFQYKHLSVNTQRCSSLIAVETSYGGKIKKLVLKRNQWLLIFKLGKSILVGSVYIILHDVMHMSNVAARRVLEFDTFVQVTIWWLCRIYFCAMSLRWWNVSMKI